MDDLDKTMPGRRYDAASDSDAADVTMPGKRDRKPDGRFAVGDLIMNRYEVLAELGQGGMGVVYKCFDKVAGIEVALKALPPELSHNTLEMEDIKENFQLVAKLVHQNIAISKNLELDRTNGNYYLIMECVEGEDLRRWLKRKRKEGPLTPDMVLPIIRQVAAALDYAHKEKIIHRDIKPGNIMINANGHVKVLDFGLAAQIHTSMTRVSMAYHGTSGTGPYMAPEQWRGQAQGGAADQYALAVMTYEMLAGHLPFESTDVAVLQQAVLTQEAATLAGVPQGVNRAIERAMSKEAADRFSSCTDFVDALGGKKVSSPAIRKGSGKKMIFAIAAIILLACGAVLWVVQNARNRNVAKPTPVPVIVPEVKPEVSAPAETPPEVKPETPPEVKPEAPKVNKEEFFRHYAEVAQSVKRINAVDYDRGETFGTHLENLTIEFNAATAAQNKEEYAIAENCLKRAETQIQWLETNALPRKEAKQLLAELPPLQKEADNVEASKYAATCYTAARQACRAGEKALNDGKFDEAGQQLSTAKEKFVTARDTAHRFLVKLHMDSARKALSGKQWQTALQEAQAVLKLDSANEEAKALKKQAENALKPYLKVYALVNGETVSASVKFTPGFVSEGENGIELAKGTTYQLAVEYKTGDEVWRGSHTVTANWGALQEVRVKLKKEEFTGMITLPGNVVLKLLPVKAGTFTMGSPSTEDKRSEDEKPHQVRLTRDYWLGETEVTQAQWQAVMDDNPSRFKGDNLPVEQVSWDDAMAFCRKLNELTAGKRPAGYVYSLPTEAQWEYACRAGSTTAFSYGDASDADMMNHDGNYPCGGGRKGKYLRQTTPVRSYRPNAWGFYDMHGNVWEWCADWYGSYGGDAEDPTGPSSGSCLVFRGGSWCNFAGGCRSAYRASIGPGDRYFNLGFRVALVPGQ